MNKVVFVIYGVDAQLITDKFLHLVSCPGGILESLETLLVNSDGPEIKCVIDETFERVDIQQSTRIDDD